MLILIALMFLITVLTLLPFDKQGRQFGSTKEAGAWVMGDVHHLPERLAPASLERKDNAHWHSVISACSSTGALMGQHFQ